MKCLFCVAIVIIGTVNMVNCQAYNRLCVNIESGDSTEYSVETQLCCNGHLYDKNPRFYQNCCGEAGPYATDTHTCCGNEIVSKFSELKCCNDHQTYNDTTHICCGSTIRERNGEDVICCGQHLMKRLEQTCCPTGPRSYAPPVDGRGRCCGSDKVYTPSTQLCCETGPAGYPPQISSRIHNIRRNYDIQCCGLDFYVTSAEICCQGTTHRKDTHTSCCGKQAYDSLNQVCCDGIVSDIVNAKTECCGKTPYNPTIEQCCLFKVSSVANGKCCSNQAYHPSESSCCDGDINHGIPEIEGVQRCCAGLSYLETHQICCNGQLLDQQKDMNCCGKNMYNTTTHLCCAQDSIVARKSSGTRCCGRGVFESNTETCCEAANRGFHGVGRQCCRQNDGNVVAYDPTQDTCCSWRQYERFHPGIATSDAQCCHQNLVRSNQLCDNGYLVDKEHPNDDMVCRARYSRSRTTYNSKTEVCTSNGIPMLKGPHQERCGGSLYDTVNQICCQGMVHSKYDERTGNQKLCCQPGVRAYINETQTCCAGRVANVHPNVAGCCRNNPYDITTHTCDHNGLVRPTDEVNRYPNMCGDQPYHPDEQFCCGGDELIGWGQTCCNGYIFNTSTDGINTGMCCGFVGYNPNVHVCCGGNLGLNSNPAVTCCGNVLWDPTTSDDICCESTFQPIQSPSGDRLNCSGQMAYNIHRETVCDGVRHQEGHGHCCGKKLFNPEEEICCSGHISMKTSPDTQCCGTLPYITSDLSIICCGESTLHYDAQGKQCCGSQAIDINQKQCCTIGEIPYTYKINQNTCCSSNTAKDTCCHGNLHLNIKNGVCCGSTVIRHPDHEMCCEGVKFSKEYGTNSICCGEGVIDSRVYTCCNGRRIRKQFQGCCNNQVFAKYGQACCGTEIYNIHSSQICCNKTLHDAYVDGCCNGKPYTKGKHGCCLGAIYDAANQVCQEGKIGIRERRHTTVTESPMCNGLPYNEEKEGCCGTAVFRKAHLGCCNGHIFNLHKAVCCGDEISYKRNGKCCGETNKAYNSHRYICCSGVIRKKIRPTDQCCGKKAYQNETQMCCHDKVYDRYLNKECCGNQVFSPNYEICCRNSNIVETTASYLVPSCYTKLYDTVSEATVWVQKMKGQSKRKRGKQ